MRTAIVNLDRIVTGSLTEPFAPGDGLLMEDGRITAIGTLPADKVAACDVVVDAGGTIAIPA
jgi:enamidase